MSEITVSTPEGGEPELEDEAAHAAAVHEGAAEVRADQAEEAAGQAAAAAAAAVSAVQVTTEAAEVATAAAESSDGNARLIAEALDRQSAALTEFGGAVSSLLEEMRANRKPARPSEPVKQSPDKPPSSGGRSKRSFRSRYYGG